MSFPIAYFILAFVRGPEGDLQRVEPEKAESRDVALAQAAAMVDERNSGEAIVGAVVCARTADPRLPNYAALAIVERYGQTPGREAAA